MDKSENSIEFLKGSKRATVSFSQSRYVARIKSLAKQRPNECLIVAENTDGSICAHIPVNWIKIAPPASRTEKQVEAAKRNMEKSRTLRGK